MTNRNFIQAVNQMLGSMCDKDAWTIRLFYGLYDGIEKFDGALYAHPWCREVHH